MPKVSRRGFLRKLAFGKSTKSDTSSPASLVVVFLRGGADTLNMLIPNGDDDYYRARPTIGLKVKKSGSGNSDLAIPITDFYSFHPRLEPLVDVFKSGQLSIVQAVGSDNTSGSHFEAQDQMEHGESSKLSQEGGWLGRHLFYQQSKGASPLKAVAMGNTFPESLRGAPSASAIKSIDDINLNVEDGSLDAYVNCLHSLYSDYGLELGHAGLDTLNLLSKIESIKSQKEASKSSNDYPEDDFGKALIEVARLIKGNLGLQIACVDSSGWDTHFVQGGATGLQAMQIDSLAKGLRAFWQDINTSSKNVTVLVLTEFGRRSYENSSLGTDHGRGFSTFLLSNRISGGQILGKYPGIHPNGYETILGPAGLAVKIDYRDILWEIVEGILGNDQVGEVFPDFKHKKINLVKGV